MVNRYMLDLDYAPADASLSGTVEIRIQPSALLSGVSFDCTGPIVSAVTVNGVRSEFSQDSASGKVHVVPPSPLNGGQLARIVMTYSARPSTVAVAVAGIGRPGWFSLTSGTSGEGDVRGDSVATTWATTREWLRCRSVRRRGFRVPTTRR